MKKILITLFLLPSFCLCSENQSEKKIKIKLPDKIKFDKNCRAQLSRGYEEILNSNSKRFNDIFDGFSISLGLSPKEVNYESKEFQKERKKILQDLEVRYINNDQYYFDILNNKQCYLENQDLVDIFHKFVKNSDIKKINEFTKRIHMLLNDASILFSAIETNKIAIVKSVLDYKPSLTELYNKMSVLGYCLWHDKNKSIIYLLMNKETVNQLDGTGKTPLNIAISYNQKYIIDLLENGADINHRAVIGLTEFQRIFFDNCLRKLEETTWSKFIERLIEKYNADVNANLIGPFKNISLFQAALDSRDLQGIKFISQHRNLFKCLNSAYKD